VLEAKNVPTLGTHKGNTNFSFWQRDNQISDLNDIYLNFLNLYDHKLDKYNLVWEILKLLHIRARNTSYNAPET
jgi:hypothetical protein